MNTAQRIKKINNFLNIKKYLEIGVQQGHTFNNLELPYKVAVDPLFQFDYKNFENPSCKFFETTSDDYFINHSNQDIFDLIFLDGLHEFPQTLRDFNSAIKNSNKQTLIILDDVFPNDVYSSLIKNPYLFRKMNDPENNDGSWHGDVFKTIFFIHDFFPTYTYCTIDYGYGNPQALIFQKDRFNFKPRFNDLEKISRLTYFDLHENIDILNLMSEDSAIDFYQNFLAF